MEHYESYPVLVAHHEIGTGSTVDWALSDLVEALEARHLTVTLAKSASRDGDKRPSPCFFGSQVGRIGMILTP
jgi:hypothetical protein